MSFNPASTGYNTYVGVASDNLITLLQGVSTTMGPVGPAGETLQVCDGMPVEFLSNYSVTLEGWSNWQQSWFSLGFFDRIETFDLNLLIHVWQGNVDAASRRTEALSIVNAIRVALYEQIQSVQQGGSFLGCPGAADFAIITGDPVQGPASGSSGWGIDLSLVIHAENVTLIG